MHLEGSAGQDACGTWPQYLLLYTIDACAIELLGGLVLGVVFLGIQIFY